MGRILLLDLQLSATVTPWRIEGGVIVFAATHIVARHGSEGAARAFLVRGPDFQPRHKSHPEKASDPEGYSDDFLLDCPTPQV